MQLHLCLGQSQDEKRLADPVASLSNRTQLPIQESERFSKRPLSTEDVAQVSERLPHARAIPGEREEPDRLSEVLIGQAELTPTEPQNTSPRQRSSHQPRPAATTGSVQGVLVVPNGGEEVSKIPVQNAELHGDSRSQLRMVIGEPSPRLFEERLGLCDSSPRQQAASPKQLHLCTQGSVGCECCCPLQRCLCLTVPSTKGKPCSPEQHVEAAESGPIHLPCTVRQIGHVLENRCCLLGPRPVQVRLRPDHGIFNGLIDSTGIEQKMDLLRARGSLERHIGKTPSKERLPKGPQPLQDQLPRQGKLEAPELAFTGVKALNQAHGLQLIEGQLRVPCPSRVHRQEPEPPRPPPPQPDIQGPEPDRSRGRRYEDWWRPVR